MPVYEIEHPTTGQKIRLEGNGIPSDADIREAFNSVKEVPKAPTAKPKSRAEMQKEFASQQGTPETAAKYGVTSGDIDGVPQWGRDHPNLYGLYGAAKGVGAATVEGIGTALGAAGGGIAGAATPIPGGAAIGTLAGGGAGYAGAKRLNSAIGLSDEPMDNSAAGIGKDVAVGAALGAIPMAGGIAAKGARAVLGDTAVNLVSKVPVGRGMLAEARLPDVPKVTAEIDKSLAKAIRPSVAGKSTAAQAEAYADNARTAVKEIVLNKDNLGLTNELGEPVDHLPKTLPEFRQAIDSTKKSIWKKVQYINQAAGETGAEVPLQSAVDELRTLATKPVYKTMSPETVNYAESRAAALEQQKAFTVEDAQDAITMANQSLKNFYKNPSAETSSKAYVDSLIANHLRANLDTALEAATGTSEAAPLRKAYGALKAIEKDVNQRAVVDARKNTAGLVDFSDIYTAGELVKSMALMDPVGAIKTSGMAAVKAYIKRANNPNTHVERVFKLADKLVKAEAPTVPAATPTPAAMPAVASTPVVVPAQPAPLTAREQLAVVSKPNTSTAAAPVTWREFISDRMGGYMKEEGGHTGAMKRISREWSEHKAKGANQ